MTSTEFRSIEAILVKSDRQRTEDAAAHIKDLTQSILENGLLHAVVIDDQNNLVAGFCRLKAMIALHKVNARFYYNKNEVPSGLIPTVQTHHTDQTSLFQLELEENLRRKNLSHIELARAIAQLHRLRQAADPAWNQTQTAEEVAKLRGSGEAVNQREVAESIILEQFADDPDVRKAPTRSSAVRVASRKLEQQALAALGVTASISSSRHKMLEGDASQIMDTLPKGTFDCIITDPPYGMEAHKFGDKAFLGAVHGYKDDKETSDSVYTFLAQKGYWLCREEAHLFAFCDVKRFFHLRPIFEDVGWRVWKTPLIWVKGNVGHAPLPEYGPRRSYETILFAFKGDRKVLKTGSDVIDVRGVDRTIKLHPAGKPSELYEELLSWVLLPGMKVLDPFCGSGPVFQAADNLGGDATGIEQDHLFAGICKQILDELNK